jgi:hypothetical protein
MDGVIAGVAVEHVRFDPSGNRRVATGPTVGRS